MRACVRVCACVCTFVCVCVVCKCGVHFNGDHCPDMLLSLQHVCVCVMTVSDTVK